MAEDRSLMGLSIEGLRHQRLPYAGRNLQDGERCSPEFYEFRITRYADLRGQGTFPMCIPRTASEELA